MSYAIEDAIGERHRDLSSDNPEELYRLAQIIKAEGNDELAEEVLRKAQRLADDADWAYDRWSDNQLMYEGD